MSKSEIHLPTTVIAWADILVKEWVKRARELNISPDNPINIERFYHYITTQANGDPATIQFTFDYYLKFTNWGVGNGVTLDNRDTLILAGMTRRRPRPFYDDVLPKQLSILAHLMLEKYGHRVVAFVKTTIEQKNVTT